MEKIIEVKQINKYFGQGDHQTHALKDVSMDIYPRDFISIMGPSGSGKSTLLFAISGMDSINSGTVLFKGKSLHEMKDNEIADTRRKEMGFVFQDATLLNNLNLLDNIILPSYDAEKKHLGDLIQRAKQTMDQVGIGGLEDRNITQVSGGQLQRASICRGILHQPDILFGDEPTGALNSKTSEEIMDLMVQLNEAGLTVLLVTHDAKVSSRAKRVIFMKDGELESELTFDQETVEEKLTLINHKMTELGI